TIPFADYQLLLKTIINFSLCHRWTLSSWSLLKHGLELHFSRPPENSIVILSPTLCLLMTLID
ncbi:MAG: hypothetical protein KJ714_09305, partial [Euryarchaeota archaeon]|nr:hypothetical protein [Euryarchaeota archaeon]